MNSEKIPFKGDIDWAILAACLAVGFVSGLAANWWWSRRTAAAREKEDGEPRVAMTFPFL